MQIHATAKYYAELGKCKFSDIHMRYRDAMKVNTCFYMIIQDAIYILTTKS